MAKEIKFNVRVSVDGKEQLVTATTSVAGLREAMERAKGSAGMLRDSLLNFNQTILVFQNLSAAISQITGTLNNITEESRTFSGAMKAANTMAGEGSEGFAKLKDQVSELSKTVPMARDELARGLYQVISNGVPKNNWISYLESSAKSAIGGIADINEVVKVTSTVIKNYGMEWSAAGDIQDKIQLTAKNGVTSFEQLAAALPSVTGQASQLGVSLNEMLAVMSTLTGVTGNTTDVTTQLSSMLTALSKETDKSQKMAEAMGISFNAASVKAAGGLRNFLRDLDRTTTAYAAKTGMLKESIYTKLFGRAEALRMVNALTGQLAGKFDENIKVLEKSAGTMDRAYSDMSSTGAAALQKLKNEWASLGDYIQATVGGMMPLLNFTSQFGMSAVSVMTLTQAFKKLHIMQLLISGSLFRAIATHTLFIGNARKTAIATHVMSQHFRSAATRAIALKIAMRGLLIASGVVGVLGFAVSKLVEHFHKTEESADEAGNGIDKASKKIDKAKQAYDNTLSSTYKGLTKKYSELRSAWRALSADHQKIAWIKKNQDAFNSLQIQIKSIADAETIFNNGTDAVVDAFSKRAKAAARMAQLTELYRKQIELTDKRSSAEASIMEDARYNGRKAKEGDVVPEGWRNERYGKVDRDGQWRFSKKGAELYSGADVSSSASIRKIDAQITENNAKIRRAEKQYAEESKSAKKIVKPVVYKKGKKEKKEKKKDPPPALGSVDWFEKKLEKLRKQVEGAGNEEVAKMLQADYKAVEQEFKDYKIRIGLEAPDKVEVKTYVEKLQEELSEARKTLENATTIEARVKASAEVDRIQAEINEATTGQLTIKASVDPSYIEKGSSADKRQSYSNAQQNVSMIEQDYKIGIVGEDEALESIAKINLALEGLGLNPIEFKLDTDDLDKAQKKMAEAKDSISSMFGAIAGLGSALEMPELNAAGTIAQAIATIALSFAQALSQSSSMGPWGWIAFAAAGLAEMTAVISSIKGATAFANGGVVSGPTLALVGEYAGARNNPEVIAPLNKLRDMIEPANTGGFAGGSVHFEIDGRKLVGVLANETRIGSKSGRRTGIKL